jgi:hypothetical protein
MENSRNPRNTPIHGQLQSQLHEHGTGYLLLGVPFSYCVGLGVGGVYVRSEFQLQIRLRNNMSRVQW